MFALLFLVSLSACSSNSTLPDVDDLNRYEVSARAAMAPEKRQIETDHAAGRITEAEYQAQLADFERRVAAKSTDAAWTSHSLAEGQRKIQGYPTPDADQLISVPQAGSGAGAIPTQGSYRRFNEQDVGGTTNPSIAKEFFRGYTPGGAVKGSNGPGS